jgi:hypothetical protein
MIFKPNPSFEREIAAEEETKAGLARAAEPARANAENFARQAGAPWMARSGHQTVEIEVDDQGVALVNTDYAGHLQEYGSTNNPPHAPLRRGALAAGFEVVEES